MHDKYEKRVFKLKTNLFFQLLCIFLKLFVEVSRKWRKMLWKWRKRSYKINLFYSIHIHDKSHNDSNLIAGKSHQYSYVYTVLFQFSKSVLNNFRVATVMEKSGNLKINGFGRQSSENLFILFKRGKDVLSHEIKPISFLIGGYS